jgi:hypothetical protein
MKTLLASFALSLLALAGFSSSARADVVTIDSDSYAAVAYSPKTGKYGYAWGCGSRGSAERAALSECKEDDAKIVGWVNAGFLVLVIADDNAYGCGYSYGDGATNTDAHKSAVKELRKHSDVKVKVIVVLCSSGLQPQIIKN